MKTTLDKSLIASKNGNETARMVEEPADTDLYAMERIFKALQPGPVFGAPVVAGEYTVITASELASGGGFGMGRNTIADHTESTGRVESPTPNDNLPANWGGGGGGGAVGRPVALVVIGPKGVKVEPVVDVTKVIVTTFLMWRKMMPSLVKASAIRKMRKA